MIEELIELVAEIVDLPENQIDEKSGPMTLTEWDSLAHFCIVAAIEEKYKIKLEMNQIITIKSIKDIENFIKEKQ